MQTWTIEEMMKLSVLDILDLPIPAEDRIRASLQSGDHVLVAVEAIVRLAIESYDMGCAFLEVKACARRWLSGKDRIPAAAWAWAEEARAARAKRATEWAVRVAEWVAAAAAATAAKTEAEWTRAAATEAQWDKACAAMLEAAEAAHAAERDRQIEDIRAAVMGAQPGEEK
jgi:hypothetical protein